MEKKYLIAYIIRGALKKYIKLNISCNIKIKTFIIYAIQFYS